MENRSPLQESTMSKVLPKTLLLAFCLAFMPTTWAQEAGENYTPLSPYSVKYVTTSHGLKIKLSRKLEPGPDNSFTLTNGGKFLGTGIQEASVFSVDGLEVIPRSYTYQGSGLIKRRREVHFTPGADTIRSLYKDQWYDLPYTEQTLDRMSQQEKLRLMLLNKPWPGEDITMRVADGKRVKDYRLEYVGEETLDTPMGKVETLHFERIHSSPERQSHTWVAPAWDYLMVKTTHVEDGKSTEMLLTGGAINGQPIKGR